MTNKEFLRQFAHFIDAPGGVQKLREMILRLGLQGKLVPHIDDDYPVTALFDAIASNQKQLQDEGIAKKEKSLPPISKEETEHLPKGWRASRLAEISGFNIGRTPPTKDASYWDDTGIPWVSIKDLVDKGHVTNTAKGITTDAQSKVFKRPPVRAGTILVSFKLTIGKISILDIDAYHNEAIASLVPYVEEMQRFLFIFLPQLMREGDTKNAIKGKTLNSTSLKQLVIPIPPLAEQQRIVAKVDELMHICDQLEAKHNARHAIHQQVILAVHSPLVEAVDSKATKLAWHRIRNNFACLYSTLDSVQALRQTILQLAMTGKLLPQDKTDAPASELLNNISIKKKELINAGKIKKQKSLPPLSSDEMPSKAPSGWECVRLQDVTNLITDGKHGDCNDLQNSGFYFLSAKDIQNGRLIYDSARQIEPSEFQEVHQRTDLEPLDICMVNTGATVGKIAIAMDNGFTSKTTFQKSVAVIKPAKPFIDTYYLALFLKSETANFLRKSGGSAINNLLLGDLKKKAFMCPPFAEQHRIVAKVNELMALCDQLEIDIRNKNETASSYTEAIVHRIAAA